MPDERKGKKVYKKLILGVVVALLIAGLSFFAGSQWAQDRIVHKPDAYPLLAKRLFIEDPSDTIINFEPLRSKLRDELSYYSNNASLYFEYLPTGTSIRVGDSKQLVGASLLKLPYVMDLYHLAELKRLNLDDKITLKSEWLDDQYGELHKKGAGHSLTIRELTRIAIQDSDNTAINGVKSLVADAKLDPKDSSFNALDVDFGTKQDKTVELSSRAYSSFLKCLYFACYLSKGDSQEVLSYLSHTTVGDDRLPKYIPKSTTVAHKIGVLGEKIQGDCGIVYVEHRNYVLCVLLEEGQTKGSEVIAELSKHVYDYVTQAQ
ncbi:MAG TPA: serine hydrolase [Verrucomicrobiae bacterium]|nr:serine hydrolase [Verrucomicrobiae bacterium]